MTASPGSEPSPGDTRRGRPSLVDVATTVREVLEEAQRRGFLGPGPVESHVRHAWPLVDELPPAGHVLDLGSGGGVPALVLALALPGTSWVLVESHRRRAAWLEDAGRALDLAGRITVLEERAEVTGRGLWRGQAVGVVARSFGPPAVTAECAAPLLTAGATCWVAEPPDPDGARWPAAGLALLGLAVTGRTAGWVALGAVSPCPDRYPRRVGVPAKRPLF
jgi:16S rRNA (guanine527-N7)-methyltransferase